jgi:heat shock protein HslJ
VTSLEGVPWVLASGLDVEGWEETAPSATFADGTVAGSTGCNRFTASYTVDGDALEIGQIASTRMACAPPADAVEREYVAALGRVTAWRLENGDLALVDADRAEVLRYEAATPVGSWQATGIRQADAVVSPIPGTEITASFDEAGTLSGSAGCNSYTATYTTDVGEIEITAPASTMKACVEPEGVMEQEAAYLLALPTAVRYRVAGRSLELLTAEGTLVASYSRGP